MLYHNCTYNNIESHMMHYSPCMYNTACTFTHFTLFSKASEIDGDDSKDPSK